MAIKKWKLDVRDRLTLLLYAFGGLILFFPYMWLIREYGEMVIVWIVMTTILFINIKRKLNF